MEKEENLNVKLEDDFKPRKWLLILLIIAMGAIIGVLIYYGISDYKEYRKNHPTITEKANEKANDIEEQIDKVHEEIDKQTDQWEIDSFNNDFEMYSGTEYGNQIVHLLDKVITNNKKNADHQLTITFNGQSSSDPETIRSYKSGLEDWTKYEVIMDYDETGYINKIEVRK